MNGPTTLQSTALVERAYARMCEATGLSPRDRNVLFASLPASCAMCWLTTPGRQTGRRSAAVMCISPAWTTFAHRIRRSRHRQFAVGEVDATAATVAQKWTSSRSIQALQRLQALNPRHGGY